jgi:hypothetical protein
LTSSAVESVNGTSTWRPLGPQCVGPSGARGPGDPARAGFESPAASATSEASGVTASTKSLPTASSSGPRRCTGMHCRCAPSGKRTEVQTRPEQLGPQHRPLGGRRQYRVPQLGEHGGSLPGIGMGPPLCPKGFRTAGRCSGSRPGAAGWRRCAPRASEPPTAVVGGRRRRAGLACGIRRPVSREPNLATTMSSSSSLSAANSSLPGDSKPASASAW